MIIYGCTLRIQIKEQWVNTSLELQLPNKLLHQNVLKDTEDFVN